MPSFAEGLTALVATKRLEHNERAKSAEKWVALEDKLLDRALDNFQERCRREAESGNCKASISFEVITREVKEFPSRKLADSTYIVDAWGDDLTGDSWFYATRGASASWSPGAPVLFAEVLESMMPKFLERVKTLGFNTCNRIAGSWKVSVSWGEVQEESAPKKQKKQTDDTDTEKGSPTD